jgi:hypothetical protein
MIKYNSIRPGSKFWLPDVPNNNFFVAELWTKFLQLFMSLTFQIRDNVCPINAKAIIYVIYVEEVPGSNVGRNIDHHNCGLSCYPRVIPGESYEKQRTLPVDSLQLH